MFWREYDVKGPAFVCFFQPLLFYTHVIPDMFVIFIAIFRWIWWDSGKDVKPACKVLVSFLSYPCNRTCKTLGLTGVGITWPLIIGADWLITSSLASVAISSCFCGGFVLCVAVRRHEPADELTMTFLFAKWTSVCKAAFPLGTCSLVKGTTEAGEAESCASGTIVTNKVTMY